MSVEERRRIRLFERWVATWGQEDAETMLELVPPAGRNPATSDEVAAVDARLATTAAELERRLEHVRFDLEQRIDATRAQLEQRIDASHIQLEQRIDASHIQLEQRIDATRTELGLQLEATAADLTATFRAEIRQAIVAQTRTTVFSMVTAFAAVSALALGLG